MSGEGYTPAFETMYTGTLFGRWPAAAVWATLIPLINRRGEINMTYEAISGMTGWPMDLLRQGIDQLMQPDPGSRSPAESGRRLILLDPRREWGWRAVNHGIYRERARKQAYDAQRTESGADAERKRSARAAPVPTCPDVSRRVPTCPDVPTVSRSPEAEAEANPLVVKGNGTGSVPRAPAREAPKAPAPVPRETGVHHYGSRLTMSAEEALEAERSTWIDTGVCVEAMESWIHHCANLKPPKDLPGHVRIAIAKRLSGWGDHDRQRRLVEFNVRMGWRNLRFEEDSAAEGAPPANTWRPDPGDDETAEASNAAR